MELREFFKEFVFNQKALGRAFADFPLIVFAIIGSEITHYVLTSDAFDFWYIIKIIGITTLVVFTLLLCYALLYFRISSE